jgi:hypothetical protein
MHGTYSNIVQDLDFSLIWYCCESWCDLNPRLRNEEAWGKKFEEKNIMIKRGKLTGIREKLINRNFKNYSVKSKR